MRRATTALDATNINIQVPTTKQILHGATTAATKSLALQTLQRDVFVSDFLLFLSSVRLLVLRRFHRRRSFLLLLLFCFVFLLLDLVSFVIALGLHAPIDAAVSFGAAHESATLF